MLAGPASPGLLFSSKMDFHRPHVSQHFSNDKDNDQQDVSSLPFYPKTRSVNRLFRIPTFFFWSIFDVLPKNWKNVFFQQKKNAAGRSIRLIKNVFYLFSRFFYYYFNAPPHFCTSKTARRRRKSGKTRLNLLIGPKILGPLGPYRPNGPYGLYGPFGHKFC